jgi:hypothetical protein
MARNLPLRQPLLNVISEFRDATRVWNFKGGTHENRLRGLGHQVVICVRQFNEGERVPEPFGCVGVGRMRSVQSCPQGIIDNSRFPE